METATEKPKVKQLKEDLDQKQLKAFDEVKQKVVEETKKLIDVNDKEKYERYTEDNQIVRILQAREYKVDKALEMWKKWAKWRLDFKADEIKEEDIVTELKSGKAFWHGIDKLGNPCLVVKVKYHQPGASSQEVVLKYFLFLLEEGIKKCEALGTGKISVIWDREGFDRKNFDTKLFNTFKQLNQIIQDNYAERLSTVYILNPNWFFKTIFAIVKPFLTQRTKSKITIIDKTELLQQYFEPDQLLVEHGGTSDYKFVYPPSISSEQTDYKNINNKQIEVQQKENEQKNLTQQKNNKNQSQNNKDESNEDFREDDEQNQQDNLTDIDIHSLSNSVQEIKTQNQD